MKLTRIAKEIAIGLLFAIGVADCAHTPPIVHDVVTCAGQAVAPADVAEAYQDLAAENWGDLTAEAIRLGWDTIACVIDELTAAHPEVKAKGDRFKSEHAKQIRDAQGPSADNGIGKPSHDRGGPAGSAQRAPAGPAFAYAGENVGAAAARCDAACGSREAIGSPGGDCLCRRKIEGKLRWLAAR